jgi:hypothetical protein
MFRDRTRPEWHRQYTSPLRPASYSLLPRHCPTLNVALQASTLFKLMNNPDRCMLPATLQTRKSAWTKVVRSSGRSTLTTAREPRPRQPTFDCSLRRRLLPGKTGPHSDGVSRALLHPPRHHTHATSSPCLLDSGLALAHAPALPENLLAGLGQPRQPDSGALFLSESKDLNSLSASGFKSEPSKHDMS